MTPLIIAFHGIGGSIFSLGLDDIVKTMTREGWAGKVYAFTEGKSAAEEWKNHNGPIAVIWHSAGAAASEDFAKEYGKSIDVGFSVDAWLPFQTVAKNYRRVFSIKAENLGRFHMLGGNVVQSIVIPDTTHTTVDDSKVVKSLVVGELRKINAAQAPAERFYIGQYKPLSDADMAGLAAEHGIPEYLLRAVVEVEAAGRGSWTSGALVFRYELHKAWQYAGAKRDALFKLGFANPSYEKALAFKEANSYPVLDRVSQIAGDEVAALSSSFGLGQIMGFNHAHLGFDSAVEMVKWLAQSEANQIEGMIRFITFNHLKDDLLAERWTTFARGYNGQGQKGYDKKLAQAAKRWKAKLGTGTTVPIPQPPEEPEKEKPPMLNAIDGYKTFIVAGIVIAIGVSEGLLGWDIPGVTVDQANWFNWVLTGLGIGSFRDALKKFEV